MTLECILRYFASMGFTLLILSQTFAHPTPSTTPDSAFAITTIISPSNHTDVITSGPNVTDEGPVAERTGKSDSASEPLVTKEATSKNSDVPNTPTKHAEKVAAAVEGDSSVQQTNDNPSSKIKTKEKQKIESELGPGKKSEVSVEVGKLKPLVSKDPQLSPEDKSIQRQWGGTCTLSTWNVCSRISSWGGDYLVPSKTDPEKLLVKHFKIQCFAKTEKTYCLKNGYTIQRCHMLCMSQCNVEYRQNYDKLVLHEGECRMPILGRRK